MNDIEIRIACVQAAVATVGNPNHINQAREYYNFVTEQAAPEAPAEETQPSTARKGSRK